MGLGTTARLIRTDRGRQLQGSMEVTEYQPVSSSTVASRFGPFYAAGLDDLAPVAPTGTRLQLVIKPRPAGSWGLLLPLMKRSFRKTMLRSLRSIK
jgi:hypothetical protein